MRKIILNVAVSLDGLIEGPNGEYDWCFTDQDYGMKNFLKNIDTILYGRKSYELMARMDGGNPFGNIKGYVFSNTLKEVQNGYDLVSGNALEAIAKLKEGSGKNIWLFGGAVLTASLMNARLVDELSLAVHPIVLGAGKALFDGMEGRVKLTLLENKVYDSGLVSLHYKIIK